ncbi:unnamed protein product [Rhodiola kirilowii]
MSNCCYLFLIIFVCEFLSSADAGNIKCRTNLVVDKSGNGNFRSISSAINSVPSGNENWVCIKVNAGIYREKVTVPLDKNYIMLKGSGSKATRIEMSDYGGVLKDISTIRINADNFVAKDITFVNSYNVPWNNGNPRATAPAAYLGGDKISFYNCAFIGLQDTLFDAKGRHYFKNCYIVGAVDFIFGAAQSVYQDSTIYVVGDALNGAGYITAQGRDNPNSPSWFIFIGGKVIGKGKTYLGRPWRPYARVLFYETYLSDIVVPDGWSPWDRNSHQSLGNTVFSEYKCSGPGSKKSGRVPWRVELGSQEVRKLVSRSFIDSDNWIENQQPS